MIRSQTGIVKAVSAGQRFALFAAVVLLSHGARAQDELSSADYIAIQQLVNRLNFALDYCTNGGQDFADLFVDGGEFVIDFGNDEPSVRNSRQALIELAGGPSCDSRRTPPSAYILHLADSLVIEPAPDGARGTSYAIYPANHGEYLDADTIGQLGIYHDEYVRTENGWRFRRRRHEVYPAVDSPELRRMFRTGDVSQPRPSP